LLEALYNPESLGAQFQFSGLYGKKQSFDIPKPYFHSPFSCHHHPAFQEDPKVPTLELLMGTPSQRAGLETEA
jgi:hypothetical protein